MPATPSEWRAGMTAEVRDDALETKYCTEAVAAYDVFLDHPRTAFTAREVLNKASPKPFVNHPDLTAPPAASSPSTPSTTELTADERDERLDAAEERLTDVLDQLAGDGLLDQRSLATEDGKKLHYRLNPENIRTVLSPVIADDY